MYYAAGKKILHLLDDMKIRFLAVQLENVQINENRLGVQYRLQYTRFKGGALIHLNPLQTVN